MTARSDRRFYPPAQSCSTQFPRIRRNRRPRLLTENLDPIHFRTVESARHELDGDLAVRDHRRKSAIGRNHGAPRSRYDVEFRHHRLTVDGHSETAGTRRAEVNLREFEIDRVRAVRHGKLILETTAAPPFRLIKSRIVAAGDRSASCKRLSAQVTRICGPGLAYGIDH